MFDDLICVFLRTVVCCIMCVDFYEAHDSKARWEVLSISSLFKHTYSSVKDLESFRRRAQKNSEKGIALFAGISVVHDSSYISDDCFHSFNLIIFVRHSYSYMYSIYILRSCFGSGRLCLGHVELSASKSINSHHWCIYDFLKLTFSVMKRHCNCSRHQSELIRPQSAPL